MYCTKMGFLDIWCCYSGSVAILNSLVHLKPYLDLPQKSMMGTFCENICHYRSLTASLICLKYCFMVQFFLLLWFTAAGFGVIFEYTIWHNVVDYNHSIALLREPFCDEISFELFWAYFFYTLKTEFNFLMEIVPVNIKENVTFIKKTIQPMKWKWFFS